MIAFLRSLATLRNLFVGFLLVVILTALIDWVAVPGFRQAASGFVPFNQQNPLSTVMIAFERGAFGPGAPARYFRFVLLEGAYGLVYAGFTILLWCWLAARAPGTFADRILNYGLVALPLVGFGLGIGESVLFMQLMIANARDPQHDLTITALNVHRVKYVIDTLTYAFTAAYALTAIVARVMGRGRRVIGTSRDI